MAGGSITCPLQAPSPDRPRRGLRPLHPVPPSGALQTRISQLLGVQRRGTPVAPRGRRTRTLTPREETGVAQRQQETGVSGALRHQILRARLRGQAAGVVPLPGLTMALPRRPAHLSGVALHLRGTALPAATTRGRLVDGVIPVLSPRNGAPRLLLG